MILHRQKRSCSFQGTEEEYETIHSLSAQQCVSRRRHSWPSRNGLGIPYHPSQLLAISELMDDSSTEFSPTSPNSLPRLRRQSSLEIFDFGALFDLDPDLITESMSDSGQLKSDIHSTSKDIAKFIRRDFQLVLVDHELKKRTPKSLGVSPNSCSVTRSDFAHGQRLLQSIKFDSLAYSEADSVDLCIEIFEQLNLLDSLEISRSKLESFIVDVRSSMLCNPYHNWFHVVDVLQTTYCLGMKSELLPAMTKIEQFSLLIAALCHDLQHPGVTSTFLVKSRSALAALYDMDPACLEKFHSFRAFELMTSKKNGLLDGFAPDDKRDLVARVEGFILATDMGRHAHYISTVNAILEPPQSPQPADGPSGSGSGGPLAEGSDERRQLLAELLIKCADVSNVFKPFPIARRWAVHITDEFFLQGDLERSRGMPVTPICDRLKQSRVQLQVGFIDFVVGPFFRAVAALIPRLAFVIDGLARNRAAWDRCPSDAAMLLAAAAPDRGGGGGGGDDDGSVAAVAAAGDRPAPAPCGPWELEPAALEVAESRE